MQMICDIAIQNVALVNKNLILFLQFFIRCLFLRAQVALACLDAFWYRPYFHVSFFLSESLRY